MEWLLQFTFYLKSFPEEIRSRIGYLPHNPAFYPELTGFENLRFWLELNSIRDAESTARGFLAKVGLISFGDDLSGNYSRGMVQRLGFAMAISHTPTTLLLDEPFTGLDSDGIAIIEKLLTKLRDENCSILLVSHASPSYSDRTVELDRGGIS